jgi:hypothetical protein
MVVVMPRESRAGAEDAGRGKGEADSELLHAVLRFLGQQPSCSVLPKG